MYNDEQLNEDNHIVNEGDEHNDIIEATDENGNPVLLEVVRYFFYNGEEYVVLSDAHEHSGCGCGGCGCEDNTEGSEEHEHDELAMYIMKVITSEEDGEEVEEFIPVDDPALFDQLISVIETQFNQEVELD